MNPNNQTTPIDINSADSPPPPPIENPNPTPVPGIQANSGFGAPPSQPQFNSTPPSTSPVGQPSFTQQESTFDQGTPTVTSGGGSNRKKIFVIIGIVVLLLALGIGAYLLASNFLFKEPEPSPSPTPIVEEQITALCLTIKAYDADWNRLSLSDLSSLQPGDIVRFSVSGDTSSGNFDMARFSVNSIDLGETVKVKPDAEEYYEEFTVPEDTTSFNVEAQLHHSELDQWI